MQHLKKKISYLYKSCILYKMFLFSKNIDKLKKNVSKNKIKI